MCLQRRWRDTNRHGALQFLPQCWVVFNGRSAGWSILSWGQEEEGELRQSGRKAALIPLITVWSVCRYATQILMNVIMFFPLKTQSMFLVKHNYHFYEAHCNGKIITALCGGEGRKQSHSHRADKSSMYNLQFHTYVPDILFSHSVWWLWSFPYWKSLTMLTLWLIQKMTE